MNFMASRVATATILVVEDDPIVREVVLAFLENAGFAAFAVASAAAALDHFGASAVDLAIIDVNLPDDSGFHLVERLRRRHECGIIYLTSLGGSADRLRGLELGDDYLVKPVDGPELVARARAVLRRTRGSGRLPVIDLGGWMLDLVRRELADPAGMPVRLTRAEFDLFAALVQAGGTALSRDYLIEVVASAEAETGPRTIDVMVSRIRRKLAGAQQPAPSILTRPGEGYAFAPAA